MYANQLNYIQACWTVGYVIGEIPSNLLLTRVRPRFWIPAMEVYTPWYGSTFTCMLILPASMDGPDLFIIEMQHTYSILRFEILHRYTPLSSILLLTMFNIDKIRPRRKYILPRNAIHNRLVVPQRRTSQTILHLPHQQRYSEYVLWISHGGCLSARRTGWV